MNFNGKNIRLSPNPDYNYIQIDNEEFFVEPLDDEFESNKGSSSNLFILVDPSGESDDKVIKICKTPLSAGRNRQLARFRREIKAFRIASRVPLSNVIHFYKSGELQIDDEIFLYIITEKADEDLARFLERNEFKFALNQKISFCVSILNGIKQLHSAGIYHRDIKHDNILRVQGEFKVGDLGIVGFQGKDFFDFDNEKIGPYGWLSPEATNKMLTYKKKTGYTYDCDINTSSDVFQLGKLFWYIFQGNLPIGQLRVEDSNFGESDVFQIIFDMLQHRKNRRPSIIEIENQFAPLQLKYGA